MALPPMANPAARLLDFSQPMDVPLLDATVAAFYGAGSTEEARICCRTSLDARLLEHMQQQHETCCCTATSGFPHQPPPPPPPGLLHVRVVCLLLAWASAPHQHGSQHSGQHSTRGCATCLRLTCLPVQKHGIYAAPQRTAAESVLKQLQANPDAWQRVDTILETSTSQQSKFFAMQVCVGGPTVTV